MIKVLSTKSVPTLSFFFFICIIHLILIGQAIHCQEAGPIQIGVSLSLDGIYREPANMLKKGYELWARKTNLEGGLLGRQIKLIIENDHSSVENAQEIYRNFIESGQIDLLFAPYGTPITLAVSEITEAAGYVLITGGASGTQIWERGHKYVFGVYSTADRYFIGFLDLIARNGFRELTIIHENNPFNIDAAMGAVEWASKMGIHVKDRIQFDPLNSSVDQIYEKTDLNEREALILCAYPDTGHKLLQTLLNYPKRPSAICLTIAPIHPLFAIRAGPMAEGIFGPSQWEPEERVPYPGTREFIRTFYDFTNMAPSYHASSAYATGQVLARAITATRSLNNEKLRDYIVSMDTVTVVGRFKVDSQGKQIGHNPILIQWQNKKKEIVYPYSMQTAKPRF